MYYANRGGSYPDKWSEMTNSNPVMFQPATNVRVDPAEPRVLDGPDWHLLLSGGGSAPATFTCR